MLMRSTWMQSPIPGLKGFLARSQPEAEACQRLAHSLPPTKQCVVEILIRERRRRGIAPKARQLPLVLREGAD